MNKNMKLTPDTPVGEIASAHPETMRMMEALGIDYCCGGKLTLAHTAEQAGLPTATVISVLETTILQAVSAGNAEMDWNMAPLDALIDHIVATHHTYLNHELPRLDTLLATVERVHGPNHGDMLEPLVKVFRELHAELTAHLEKEEQVTFPAIRRLLVGERSETVRRTIAELEDEHERAGEALAEMHRVTREFALPEDACATFRALFEGLKALEDDIHHHIHLENNVLFPRVRAMVRDLGMAA